MKSFVQFIKCCCCCFVTLTLSTQKSMSHHRVLELFVPQNESAYSLVSSLWVVVSLLVWVRLTEKVNGWKKCLCLFCWWICIHFIIQQQMLPFQAFFVWLF